jgi:hypothetical protein
LKRTGAGADAPVEHDENLLLTATQGGTKK